jgi:hypothetical protein
MLVVVIVVGWLVVGFFVARRVGRYLAQSDEYLEKAQYQATEGDDIVAKKLPVLVAYAGWAEVRHVRYEPKVLINDIPWENFKEKYSGLVLFGSAGDLMNGGRKLPVNKLISSANYFGVDIVGGKSQKFFTHLKFSLIDKKVQYIPGICTVYDGAVHSEKRRLKVLELVARYYRRSDFSLLQFVVEMESNRLAMICQNECIPFYSIRYITDRCEKRVMLWGINHFWRIYQDWRMQRMFDRLMMEVCGE